MARKWVWPAAFGLSIVLAAASYLLPTPISSALCGLLKCDGPFTGSTLHSMRHRGGIDSYYVEDALWAIGPVVLVLLALAHLRKPGRTLTVVGACVAGAALIGFLLRNHSVYFGLSMRSVARPAFYMLVILLVTLVSARRRLPLIGLFFVLAPIAFALPPGGLHYGGKISGDPRWYELGSLVPIYVYGSYVFIQAEKAAKGSRRPEQLSDPPRSGDQLLTGDGA